MNKDKTNQTGSFSKKTDLRITVVSAVLLIVLCAIIIAAALAQSAKARENVLNIETLRDYTLIPEYSMVYGVDYTTVIVVETTVVMANISVDEAGSAVSESRSIVYLNGLTLSEGSISSQLAITVTSNITQNIYNLELTGRIFVKLKQDSKDENLFYWSVTAETENNTVICNIDARTGVERYFALKAKTADWDWFDNWNEEEAELERLQAEVEEAAQTAEGMTASSNEMDQEQRSSERQMAQEFIDSMSGSRYETAGIDFVNNNDLGRGAAALAACVVADADSSEGEFYEVEVKMNDGSFLILLMDADTMNVTAYERLNESYLNYHYGN